MYETIIKHDTRARISIITFLEREARPRATLQVFPPAANPAQSAQIYAYMYIYMYM